MKNRALVCISLAVAILLCSMALPALAKHDPPIDVTFVRASDDTIENNVLAKLPGETLEDNRWTKLIQEQLGINVKYLWIAKGSEQYDQKFNTSIASGEIPDIMLVNNVRLKSLYDAGLLMEVGPVFDEFSNTISKRIVEEAGPEAKIPATFDGKLYGVPQVNSSLEYTQLLWLRKDWLDKFGLAIPKTIDEMLAVIERFNQEIPGGTGMTIHKDLWGTPGLEGFFNAYDAYVDNMWVEKDGKLVYGYTLPETKDALVKLSEMYGKGLVDKEFSVKDSGKAVEAIVSGLSGAYYGAQWTPLWPLQDNVNQDLEAEWIPAPLPTATDHPAKSQMYLGTTDWYVINKDCQYPEAAMELLNIYIDLTFDPELQQYDYYSNTGGDDPVDAIWKLAPMHQYTAFKNLDSYHAIAEPLKTGNPGDLYGEQLTMYTFSKEYLDGNRGTWGWNKIFGDGGSWSVIDGYWTGGQTLLTGFLGVPGEAMVDYKSTLDKMLKESIVKIIVGQESVDSYDQVIATWYASGGQEMTDEANEWFESTK